MVTYHPDAACNVWLPDEHQPCGDVPAWEFNAICACGHEITGTACDPCLAAVNPGCLTCWKGGRGHRCPVQFAPSPCRCGCGRLARIAVQTSRRYRQVKGRPLRYVAGHNPRGPRLAPGGGR
jgi:hypothetical protein